MGQVDSTLTMCEARWPGRSTRPHTHGGHGGRPQRAERLRRPVPRDGPAGNRSCLGTRLAEPELRAQVTVAAIRHARGAPQTERDREHT
jgi:hypothetical protein